jgi:hypothetical protein
MSAPRTRRRTAVVLAALCPVGLVACAAPADSRGGPEADTAAADTSGVTADTLAPDTVAADSMAARPGPAPAAATPRDFPFPLPYEVDDPCEYCYTTVVVCAATPVRTRDGLAAPVVTRLVPGDTVQRIANRLHVLTPDIIVFRDTLRLAEAESPDVSTPAARTVVFRPGDTVYVFTYGYEGILGEWWHRGRMRESGNSWMSDENLPWASLDRDSVATSLGTRETRSWVRVRTPEGREGWVEGSAVRYGNYYGDGIPPCPGDEG